ncbi:hypothetical protein ACJJTC_008326 [Scirpophaga incertulas]
MSEKQCREENNCGICEHQLSKYCCPRCGVFYCSLSCYQSDKHSECSESFYRDCVTEELSSHHVDEKSKQKMVEILKKLQTEDVNASPNVDTLLSSIVGDSATGHSSDADCKDNESLDSDDFEELDLHERVKNLNLDDPDVLWEALTTDEQNEFEALLNSGDVGALIPQWDPWWKYAREEKLVEDIETISMVEENKALANCPPIVLTPKFSTLTTLEPSPAIKFNITNLIASYAFAMRYFNGEIEPVECTAYLLSICANLDTNANFEDLETSTESVAQNCFQTDLIATDAESLTVMKNDTYQILQGPSKDNKAYYCRVALSDMHRIFSKAKNARKNPDTNDKEKSEFSKKFPEHTDVHFPVLDMSKVKKCIKKIEYYLSYVESYGMEF